MFEYVVYGKDSKPLSLQFGKSPLQSFFEYDGNMFLSELWVIFIIVMVVVAIVTFTYYSIKPQNAKKYNDLSILILLSLLMSFESIDSSMKVELDLKHKFSVGFDSFILILGLHLGKIFNFW